MAVALEMQNKAAKEKETRIAYRLAARAVEGADRLHKAGPSNRNGITSEERKEYIKKQNKQQLEAAGKL